MISVVIPAYNEEKYLASTLRSLNDAVAGFDTEIIVVDNESTDATAEIASSHGAKVVSESRHNIATVRNAGARIAKGDVIAFLDADTTITARTFARVVAALKDPRCLGGSFDVEFDWDGGSSFVKREYIRLCMLAGRLMRIRMGAMQFVRREAFESLSGYDETIFVGEDGEFQYRLMSYAKNNGGRTAHIEEPKVLTSPRRINRVGLLRIVFMYHPVTIYFLWRRPSLWKDWYENAIR